MKIASVATWRESFDDKIFSGALEALYPLEKEEFRKQGLHDVLPRTLIAQPRTLIAQVGLSGVGLRAHRTAHKTFSTLTTRLLKRPQFFWAVNITPLRVSIDGSSDTVLSDWPYTICPDANCPWTENSARESDPISKARSELPSASCSYFHTLKNYRYL